MTEVGAAMVKNSKLLFAASADILEILFLSQESPCFRPGGTFGFWTDLLGGLLSQSWHRCSCRVPKDALE